MKIMRPVPPLVVRLLLTFSGMMLCSSSGFAQGKTADSVLQSVTVSVHAKQQSLAEIVKALAKQIGRGIVIDGLPLLQQADIDVEGNAKEALNQIATAYDYTWNFSKHGVILMHKRFHHLDEYPQMNLPELRETARDVIAILHALPYDTDRSHMPILVSQLYGSLTPTQEQRLREGGISAADMTFSQQSLLQQIILNNAFASSCGEWERLLQRLDLLPHAYFQTREWPFYYQQKLGKPVVPASGQSLQLEFDLIAPGLISQKPGDLTASDGEMKIPFAVRRLP